MLSSWHRLLLCPQASVKKAESLAPSGSVPTDALHYTGARLPGVVSARAGTIAKSCMHCGMQGLHASARRPQTCEGRRPRARRSAWWRPTACMAPSATSCRRWASTSCRWGRARLRPALQPACVECRSAEDPLPYPKGPSGPNMQQGRAVGTAASIISVSAWECVAAHARAPGGGARRSSRCSGTACRSSCWRTCAWRACRTPTCWPRRAHPTLPWRGARCSAWRRVPYLTAHCVLPRLAPVWTALVCTCLHDAKVVGVVHVGVKRGAS